MARSAIQEKPRERVLTLPVIANELKVSLDWLRRRFRNSPELSALCKVAGPARFIEHEDLPRVKELLKVKN